MKAYLNVTLFSLLLSTAPLVASDSISQSKQQLTPDEAAMIGRVCAFISQVEKQPGERHELFRIRCLRQLFSHADFALTNILGKPSLKNSVATLSAHMNPESAGLFKWTLANAIHSTMDAEWNAYFVKRIAQSKKIRRA